MDNVKSADKDKKKDEDEAIRLEELAVILKDRMDKEVICYCWWSNLLLI